MNELKDEINELTEKLRQVTSEQRNLLEERWKSAKKLFVGKKQKRLIFVFSDGLSKQLELTNVKLKTESLNLNLLQEQCAELEKEKNIMIIEVEALHTDFNARLALLDSEINTVRFSHRNRQKNWRILSNFFF